MADSNIKFRKSAVLDKTPDANSVEYGEVYLNFNAEHPFMSTKDSNDVIRTFSDDQTILSKIPAEWTGSQEEYDALEIKSSAITYYII